MKFAAQEQDSRLFKARWKLNDASSLQFSYVGTQVGYSYTMDANLSVQESGTLGASWAPPERNPTASRWTTSSSRLTARGWT